MSTTTSTTTRTTTATSMSSSGSMPLMAPPPKSVASNVSPLSPASNATAGPSTASTASTLRSLYPRAARALLQRDYALTHSLLESAFSLLPSPSGVSYAPDPLDTHRRKWDILRITLEASVFDSPSLSPSPVKADTEVLPPRLRANLLLSAQGLVAALHKRSVRLFTSEPQSPKTAYLPAQILVPLVFSSLKLDCPEVGRSMIEDWLAQRQSVESTRVDLEGYERVLDLFCLHVLPRCHDWEYAQEFLKYESELSEQSRQHLKSSLNTLRTREIESARSIPSPPPPSIPSTPSESSRTPSPSPSLASSSSTDTDDTHSTRTVVPNTPRGKFGMNGFTPLTPTPSGSSTSLANSRQENGHAAHGKRPASRSSTERARPSASGHGSELGINARQRAVGTHNSSTLTAALRAYLSQLGPSRILFAFLCILIPVFSFVSRLRRRTGLQPPGSGTSVDAVRRRLAGQPRGSGVLGVMWAEVARAVGDAVRMAGGGLV